jgi:hypothetical protein
MPPLKDASALVLHALNCYPHKEPNSGFYLPGKILYSFPQQTGCLQKCQVATPTVETACCKRLSAGKRVKLPLRIRPAGLRFRCMKSHTLSALVILFAFPVIAPSVELSGKITSTREGRGLTNAIIQVVSGPGIAVKKRASPKLLIRDGRLDPQVLVAYSGETLTLTNADNEPYNVQFRFSKRTELNLAMGASSPATKLVETGQPELFARVTDDLGKLHGYVCVVEHPFYALTDANGMFKMSDLPAGTYVMEAAHPREGKLKREVTVGSVNATVDFVLPGRSRAKTP